MKTNKSKIYSKSKKSKKSKKSNKSKKYIKSKNYKSKYNSLHLKYKKNSKCKVGNKLKKVNFNIVLDLDNTIISSLTKEEYIKRKIDPKIKFTPICEGLYYTLARPYLEEFLEYIFPRFHVSVWTAATKDYAKEIINKFITKKKKNRKLREFLYDEHCKESMENVNPKTMKDLRYLFISKKNKFNENNTVIVDDLKDVLKNNKNNSIDSEYFNSYNKNALNDKFLLNLIEQLDIVYESLCKL
jgi:hypothetical protein